MKVGTRVRVVGPHNTGAVGRVVERPEGKWDYSEAKDFIILRFDGDNIDYAYTRGELQEIKEG